MCKNKQTKTTTTLFLLLSGPGVQDELHKSQASTTGCTQHGATTGCAVRTPQPPQLPRSHRYTFVQTFGITQEQPETSTNTCTPRTPQQAPSQPGACMGHKAVVVCPSQPPVWGAAGLGEGRARAEPLTQRPGPAASPRAGRGRAGRRPPGGGGGKEAGKGGREAGKEAGRRRAPALEVGGRMVSGLRGGRGGRGGGGFWTPQRLVRQP